MNAISGTCGDGVTVKVNLAEIPWEERRSPKGRYHLFQKAISLALGGRKDIGTWAGGHPFDVALVRIPADAVDLPLHAHAAQWELYGVEEGGGRIRIGERRIDVGPGDWFLAKPQEAHQIENPGPGDLLLLVIANNPEADVVSYARSGKFFLKPERRIVTESPLSYYDGEE
ncbi:cupin domain-containing protein [Verrucomicrobium sp. 3C]|uniref:cupin domain-containing protein n=1 Tax=Verrucomicrobium sp. 3C TaxID=1134055 RepID=UPI001E4A835D|nr:cupin domain-containing protein [Verrucomicrobium sp. 3C]